MEMKDIQLTGIDDDDCSIHTVYENFENDIRNIFDKHVPIKERYVKINQLPYMNRNLRKAIYNKKMSYHKHTKTKILEHGKNTGRVGIL